MAKLTKLISFPKEHEYVYNYLSTMKNVSAYIVQLIIEDMKKDKDEHLSNLIRDIIAKEYSNINFETNNNTISKEDMDIINDILS